MGGSLRAKPVGVVRGAWCVVSWTGMDRNGWAWTFTQSKLNGKSDQKFF